MARLTRSLLALVLTALLAAVLAVPSAAVQGSRFRPATTSPLGIVATESPAAGAVGRDVLDRGGNAIDAAVATVFAINVARPQSCGIGGGGFMTYRPAHEPPAALDFREMAPAAYTPTTLTGPGLYQTYTGHLPVGLPGTLAGMNAALRRYGTISLREALRPAIRMARRGVVVTPALSASMAANAARLKLFPAAAAQFLVGGQTPYPAGSILRQPDLARSLELIARHGPDAFYRGRIARLIAADMAQAAAHPIAGDSAVLTQSDLGRYRAKWRAPIVGSYRGRTIIGSPPPTSGGVAIQEMLNILEGFDLRGDGMSSALSLHLIAEAQQLAWADRGAYLGDPDFAHVPTDTLISKAYAAQRRAEIDPDHAKTFGPGLGRVGGAESPHASTTDIAVIDRWGNAVSLTCTIEQEFGSAVVAPGTGFLLNNELTDFGAAGTANQAQAFKRPRSSISPEIVVRQGVPVLVDGGAGGARIVMGALLPILDTVDFGQDIAHAVDAERIEASAEPLILEGARMPAATLAGLQARGHTIANVGEYDIRPRVQAAGIDPATGMRIGVSDSRTEDGTYGERRALGSSSTMKPGGLAGSRLR
ncbi:MAG: Gamma-glutamyltranspeptidase [Solirubrobacterales bacterium]|nr:Gamma-glutamyltranspeptidase [Solirubrobacterales bacterium]